MTDTITNLKTSLARAAATLDDAGMQSTESVFIIFSRENPDNPGSFLYYTGGYMTLDAAEMRKQLHDMGEFLIDIAADNTRPPMIPARKAN